MDSNSSPNQLVKYVGSYIEVVKGTLDIDKLAHYIDQNIVIARVSSCLLSFLNYKHHPFFLSMFHILLVLSGRLPFFEVFDW